MSILNDQGQNSNSCSVPNAGTESLHEGLPTILTTEGLDCCSCLDRWCFHPRADHSFPAGSCSVQGSSACRPNFAASAGCCPMTGWMVGPSDQLFRYSKECLYYFAFSHLIHRHVVRFDPHSDYCLTIDRLPMKEKRGVHERSHHTVAREPEHRW